MKKLRVAKPAEIVDGMLVLNLDSTEASSDWLHYGRLKVLAKYFFLYERFFFLCQTHRFKFNRNFPF